MSTIIAESGSSMARLLAEAHRDPRLVADEIVLTSGSVRWFAPDVRRFTFEGGSEHAVLRRELAVSGVDPAVTSAGYAMHVMGRSFEAVLPYPAIVEASRLSTTIDFGTSS